MRVTHVLITSIKYEEKDAWLLKWNTLKSMIIFWIVQIRFFNKEIELFKVLLYFENHYNTKNNRLLNITGKIYVKRIPETLSHKWQQMRLSRFVSLFQVSWIYTHIRVHIGIDFIVFGEDACLSSSLPLYLYLSLSLSLSINIYIYIYILLQLVTGKRR